MEKALQDAINLIHKQFGKTSIMELGDSNVLDVEVIPSGSIAVDMIMGVGGFPRGRITEISGVESGGKTTLALHAIAQAQQGGGIGAFIDAEHALDKEYAKKIGVDTDHLLISQPDNGEQALEITETLIKSGAVDIVVIDSVAALTPRAEIEGEFGQALMGLHARLMGSALRKLTAVTSKSNTVLIFINQIREKIGTFYGSNETTTGGRALKFFSTIRLDVRKIKTNDTDGVKVSNRTKVKAVKNKLSSPFRECEIELVFGEGIANEIDLIELGVDKGLVDKNGVWYSMDSKKIGQGIENARLFLRENTEIRDKLESNLRKIYFPKEKK